jgi:hypothetical protein
MFRAAFAVLAVLSTLTFAADVALGSFAALASVPGIAVCVLMIVRNTRLIGSLRLQERELARPRMTPEDWRQLREMEIELGWEPSEAPAPEAGQTPPAKVTGGTLTAFTGPLPDTAALSAPMTGPGGRWRPLSELLAENKAAGACDCGGCGEASREFGRQLREQVIASQGIPPARLATADTATAATVDQYARWLRGYVKNGGEITHWYDYPFDRAGFRYADSPVTVDSDYEYGARGRRIIVARHVPTRRTRPTAAFDGWAHTRCYWMHGYRTSAPRIVAAYSDPEFGEFRRDGDVAAEHLAQLARVGREHCIGFCPICAERSK